MYLSLLSPSPNTPRNVLLLYTATADTDYELLLYRYRVLFSPRFPPFPSSSPLFLFLLLFLSSLQIFSSVVALLGILVYIVSIRLLFTYSTYIPRGNLSRGSGPGLNLHHKIVTNTNAHEHYQSLYPTSPESIPALARLDSFTHYLTEVDGTWSRLTPAKKRNNHGRAGKQWEWQIQQWEWEWKWEWQWENLFKRTIVDCGLEERYIYVGETGHHAYDWEV